jgi:transposase
LVAR